MASHVTRFDLHGTKIIQEKKNEFKFILQFFMKDFKDSDDSEFTLGFMS